MAQLAHVRTSVLDIACEQSGPPGSLPVVLLHGYPYDARAFDEVVPIVNSAGFRTIVPYLRGYGATSYGKLSWRDLIGAAVPPASFRRCGLNACAGS
jgi:pimeloyl-ACP methyl ester carboxylesterase